MPKLSALRSNGSGEARVSPPAPTMLLFALCFSKLLERASYQSFTQTRFFLPDISLLFAIPWEASLVQFFFTLMAMAILLSARFSDEHYGRIMSAVCFYLLDIIGVGLCTMEVPLLFIIGLTMSAIGCGGIAQTASVALLLDQFPPMALPADEQQRPSSDLSLLSSGVNHRPAFGLMHEHRRRSYWFALMYVMINIGGLIGAFPVTMVYTSYTNGASLSFCLLLLSAVYFYFSMREYHVGLMPFINPNRLAYLAGNVSFNCVQPMASVQVLSVLAKAISNRNAPRKRAPNIAIQPVGLHIGSVDDIKRGIMRYEDLAQNDAPGLQCSQRKHDFSAMVYAIMLCCFNMRAFCRAIADIRGDLRTQDDDAKRTHLLMSLMVELRHALIDDNPAMTAVQENKKRMHQVLLTMRHELLIFCLDQPESDAFRLPTSVYERLQAHFQPHCLPTLSTLAEVSQLAARAEALPSTIVVALKPLPNDDKKDRSFPLVLKLEHKLTGNTTTYHLVSLLRSQQAGNAIVPLTNSYSCMLRHHTDKSSFSHFSTIVGTGSTGVEEAVLEGLPGPFGQVHPLAAADESTQWQTLSPLTPLPGDTRLQQIHMLFYEAQVEQSGSWLASSSDVLQLPHASHSLAVQMTPLSGTPNQAGKVISGRRVSSASSHHVASPRTSVSDRPRSAQRPLERTPTTSWPWTPSKTTKKKRSVQSLEGIPLMATPAASLNSESSFEFDDSSSSS
jgi:hypothetical protein